jgi:hypothetical protein
MDFFAKGHVADLSRSTAGHRRRRLEGMRNDAIFF